MRNKSLFLLVACVCGTIAAIGASQYMQAHSGNGSVEMVEIFVTTQAIDEQEELTADKLRLEQWPADKVPQGSSADLAAFEGRFARQPFYAGEPVLDLKLMNEKEDIIVPKGYSVVSMPADRDGTVNLVRQGDRVDVRGFFEQGDTFARDTTLIVLSGVKVFAIDGQTKDDPEAPRTRSPKNLQLLIRKADEDAWSFAQRYGEISLTLGSPSPEDENVPEGEASPTAQKFLTDLENYRQERERLRKLALEQGQESEAPEIVEVAAKPKAEKPEFTTIKIHKGRIIEYGWFKDESVPRILSDTGLEDFSNTPSTTDTTPTTDTGSDSGTGFDPTGEDSPFFAPPAGAGTGTSGY